MPRSVDGSGQPRQVCNIALIPEPLEPVGTGGRLPQGGCCRDTFPTDTHRSTSGRSGPGLTHPTFNSVHELNTGVKGTRLVLPAVKADSSSWDHSSTGTMTTTACSDQRQKHFDAIVVSVRLENSVAGGEGAEVHAETLAAAQIEPSCQQHKSLPVTAQTKLIDNGFGNPGQSTTAADQTYDHAACRSDRAPASRTFIEGCEQIAGKQRRGHHIDNASMASPLQIARQKHLETLAFKVLKVSASLRDCV